MCGTRLGLKPASDLTVAVGVELDAYGVGIAERRPLYRYFFTSRRLYATINGIKCTRSVIGCEEYVLEPAVQNILYYDQLVECTHWVHKAVHTQILLRRRKGRRLTFLIFDSSQWTPQSSGSSPLRPMQKWSSGMQKLFSSH